MFVSPVSCRSGGGVNRNSRCRTAPPGSAINIPVTKLEVIWNGKIAARHDLNGTSADVAGTITAAASGWMLVRAWREDGDEDVLDIHPYATTSPIYVTVAGRARRSRPAATWALLWLDRLAKLGVVDLDLVDRCRRERVRRRVDGPPAQLPDPGAKRRPQVVHGGIVPMRPLQVP